MWGIVVRNAIIVGASSGIGCALAKCLAEHGYGVGLAARRLDLLRTVAGELSTPIWIKAIDVSAPPRRCRCCAS
jgi:short-subunit dehydrogenase